MAFGWNYIISAKIFTEIISGSTNSRKYFELINELKGRVLMRLRKGGLNIINIKERVANRMRVLCKSVINVNELDFQVRFQIFKAQRTSSNRSKPNRSKMVHFFENRTNNFWSRSKTVQNGLLEIGPKWSFWNWSKMIVLKSVQNGLSETDPKWSIFSKVRPGIFEIGDIWDDLKHEKHFKLDFRDVLYENELDSIENRSFDFKGGF